MEKSKKELKNEEMEKWKTWKKRKKTEGNPSLLIAGVTVRMIIVIVIAASGQSAFIEVPWEEQLLEMARRTQNLSRRARGLGLRGTDFY